MGHGRFSKLGYETKVSNYSDKSIHEVFSQKRSVSKQDVVNIEFRESRDSKDNPKSLPIIVGIDVSGSMGSNADYIVRRGFGTLMSSLIPEVSFDPHVCFLGIGDAVAGDRFPLQATQFEADDSICDQLTDIYLEGGGGGNSFESYDLTWAFATEKVLFDSFEKRKKKGYIFTIGDEEFPQAFSKDYYRTVFSQYLPNSTEEVFENALKKWNIFHVHIKDGNYSRIRPGMAEASWRERIGNRLLVLSDKTRISELISCAIEINEGSDVNSVIDSFDSDDTQSILRNALNV